MIATANELLSSSDPSSSDARDAILCQHEELRGLLARVLEAADQAPSSPRAIGALRALGTQLAETLAVHMDFEERVLPAALRDVIGWGVVLCAQIMDDHEKQRATLARALSAFGPTGLAPDALAEELRAFANTVLLDMELEERELLRADLDAIACDSAGG